MPTECLQQASEEIAVFSSVFQRLQNRIHENFAGQEELVSDMLCAFLAGGHVLLEGVPGLGKTVLAKTLANAAGMSYQRVQCTPDLMPGDIIGFRTLVETDDGRHKVVFEQGPIVSNFVLIDEINRTIPKTQSAVLEAMQESQVTVGKETIVLPKPNFFIATQNPIEHEGTYPLPEAQLDRFMVKLKVSYPEKKDYYNILAMSGNNEAAEIVPTLTPEKIIEMQALVKKVELPCSVIDYIVDIVRATQPECSVYGMVRENVVLGASPRAVQAIAALARVRSLSDGRCCVSLADVRSVVKIALRHRMILNFNAVSESITSDDIVDYIMEQL